MRTDERIVSRTEAKLLFLVSASGLMLRVTELIIALLWPPPRDGAGFAIYDIFEMKEMMSPIYSFVVFIICVPLVWKIHRGRILLSIFALLPLVIFFDRWLIHTRRVMANATALYPEVVFKTFDFALLGGSIFDLLTLVISNFLFIWQISIFYRLWKWNRSPAINGNYS